MDKIECYSKRPLWLIPILVIGLVAGCGGGDQGRDPILGAGGAKVIPPPPVIPPIVPPPAVPPILPPPGIITPPPGAIVPGAVCTVVAGPTVPIVTTSNPSSGNQFVATSTQNVANGGKLVTATFSLAMNPATINAGTFVLAPVGGTALIPASVTYDAVAKSATLTTAAALLPNSSYNAVIEGAVTSASGTPIGCNYSWNFKTAVAAATEPPPVKLGLAAPFAIASAAGVTNTPTAPNTLINGDVVLNPTATCGGVAADNAGGFGLCGGAAPAINGTVVTPTFPDTTTANAVTADLRSAFLSITPPAGPPAAGSLGGATNIAAPTTLGNTTGTALVLGDNLFFPGVYQATTSILITDDVTLDAQGNPDAVFIFQSSSSIGSPDGNAGVHPRILLINGAKASNVFWQAASSATLGTFTEWQGNILAGVSITMKTNATSCGRLFAGAFVTSGAFVFDSNVVSVPGNVNAPPTCQ